MINSLVYFRVGVMNKFMLSCSIIFTCLTVIRGQNSEVLSKSEQVEVKKNAWSFEMHYMNGDDWYVSSALTGSVHHASYTSGSESYDFRLGKQQEAVLDIPENKNKPSLSYANRLKISIINGVWNADFYEKCNQREGKTALMISQMVMQCLQLTDQKDDLFKMPRKRIIPDSWNEGSSMLKLEAFDVHDRKTDIVSWEDGSRQDRPTVLWTLCTGQDMVSYLRIEYLRGAYETEEKFTQFIEYAQEIRNEFICNSLSEKIIKNISGEVQVSICNIYREYDISESIISNSEEEDVKYDLPKEEMDVLIRQYGREHPSVMKHVERESE